MASAAINIISGAVRQESGSISVGSGEKVAVRLSRLDDDCKATLKINGNSLISYEPIERMNTVFPDIPSGHAVSVVVERVTGGVEGVIESYA